MLTALILLLFMGSVVGLARIPVVIHFEAEAGTRLDGQLRVEWLYGHLDREISMDRKKPDAAKDKKSGPDLLDRWAALKKLWDSKLRTPIQDLLRELFEQTEWNLLQIRGRLGLGDPAATGLAMGVLMPLTELDKPLHPVEIVVEPNFDRSELTGHSHVEMTVIPARLVPPLVRFAFNPTNAKEMYRLWANR